METRRADDFPEYLSAFCTGEAESRTLLPKRKKLIRDPNSNCQERDMKLYLLHDLIKWEHLYSLLPELYAEYHNLPADAD